jgi:hypothetical protein
MGLDFTVVISVRQRFGDDKADDLGLEGGAPFVGRQKDFPFQCPNVDRIQPAILLFQSHGVMFQQPMSINGQTVFGGIPSSVDLAPHPLLNSLGDVQNLVFAQWKGNVMLVAPGVLQEDNILRIQALEIGDSGNVDDFIIDNLIVIFKATARQVVGPLVATP